MNGIDSLKSLVSRKGGFARSNLFQVELPSIPHFNKYGMESINILCSDVNLPGRQIMTQERYIGVKGQKVANSFTSDDVSMTFYCLNDYGIKEYIEAWQDLIIDQDSYIIGYPNGTDGYVKPIKISQLEKGVGIDFPMDINFFGINVDIDIYTKDKVVYKVELEDAFPTTMNSISLNNEQDGLVQLNVQMSYRNWKRIDQNSDFARLQKRNQKRERNTPRGI